MPNAVLKLAFGAIIASDTALRDAKLTGGTLAAVRRAADTRFTAAVLARGTHQALCTAVSLLIFSLRTQLAHTLPLCVLEVTRRTWPAHAIRDSVGLASFLVPRTAICDRQARGVCINEFAGLELTCWAVLTMPGRVSSHIRVAELPDGA